MPIIGPNAATFGVIISAWGIIQLATTGFLFHFRSASLIDDIALEGDFASVRDFENDIEIKYESGALNCWVASLLYLATLAISAQQYYSNNNCDVTKK